MGVPEVPADKREWRRGGWEWPGETGSRFCKEGVSWAELCLPSNSYVGVLTWPGHQQVTSFGQRVFTEVVQFE